MCLGVLGMLRQRCGTGAGWGGHSGSTSGDVIRYSVGAALESEPPLVEPLEMVELPGGTFWMGSPDTDAQAYENERPQHKVTVSAFAISRYLITGAVSGYAAHRLRHGNGTAMTIVCQRTM